MVALWLLAVPAVGALALTVFNLLTWPRGRRDDVAAEGARRSRALGSVSVLIPARNEVLNIEACVRAAAAWVPGEIVVCDDGSTDGTGDVLRRLQAELPILRVIGGDSPLPPGWTGKPWACQRLFDAAHGDSCFFVDADVVVDEFALDRVASIVGDLGADVVTAVPRQIMGGPFEQLVMPLLHLTYVAWLPLVLIWRARDPRFLAANGQLLWLRKETLRDLGGFAAVKNDLVDDMALCRRAKQAGRRVVFADGSDLGRCRMYRSAREVVDGFSKNLHEGVGSSVGVFFVAVLYAAAFVVPALLLPFLPVLPVVVAVAAGLALRLLLVLRFGHPLWSALVFPVGVVAFLAIAANSVRWSWRGRIAWKGRVYAARAARVVDSDVVGSAEGGAA